MVDVGDRIFARWRALLHDMQFQVDELVTYRFTFKYVRDLIQRNPTVPEQHHFLTFFGGMYADSAAVTIRRLVDRDQDTASFRVLIESVCRYPEVLSRERFLSLYDDGLGSWLGQMVDDTFTQHAGQGDFIDPAIAAGHLSTLLDATAPVTKWVNKRIAHFDRRFVVHRPSQTDPAARTEQSVAKSVKPPTFAELHAAIDAIYTTYSTYLMLLHAASRAFVVPAIQYDWHELFRHPWLAPGMDPPPMPQGS